ncbi:MAG: tRNA (guanosine(46)-N7)-methyltransferase TrmB [Acholeplasmatales bacterium]|nr:tRNA (guanosine(46)-N7)-methyltransferase TrmB [Acholeplasmatales bacterium]MBR6288269.1 tRNA (guanosine(46)-N7)-methyltransferase TrmB [Acholeplasmatales bacterium]
MRLRKVKNARERLMVDNNKYFINEPELYKGKWNELFGNNNPLHIEIGCGKGQFMSTLAKLNPDINYIAIEKFDSVLLRCLEKIINDDIPNLKIAVMDAAVLGTYFADDEVDRIYLNFSDPWPKSHHAKRRLTSPLFLDLYKHVLKDEGEIHFKTDNRGLFEYSLESFNNNGFKLSHISLDLHKDTEKYPDNITTEFEDKWSKLGPIYRLEAKVK